MFFAVIHLDARASVHAFQPPPRKLAVLRIGINTVINIAVYGVGGALLHQRLDHFKDVGHFLRGARIYTGWFDIQRFQIAFVVLDISLRQLERIRPGLVGAVDNFVIHIGKVHHETHFVPGVFQVSADDVKNQRGHGVADVGAVVYCWSADIHAHLARFQRAKLFFFASQRVVYFQSNGIPTDLVHFTFGKNHASGRGLQDFGHYNRDFLI